LQKKFCYAVANPGSTSLGVANTDLKLKHMFSWSF